jgi:uncharacterized membrane protein
MDPRGLGTLFVIVGVVAIVIGLLVASGALSWFGRLPGDINIRGEHTRVFIPITSMLLVSLALTLILNVVRRFF